MYCRGPESGGCGTCDCQTQAGSAYPEYLCNVVSMCIEEDYDVRLFSNTEDGTSGTIRDRDGRQVAHFKPRSENQNIWQVRLSGPPVGPKIGPNIFHRNSNDVIILGVRWSEEEKDRAAEVEKQKRDDEVEAERRALWEQAMRDAAYEPDPPLTENERAWIKTFYDSEWNFHQVFGFNPFDEDDLRSARTLVRDCAKAEEESAKRRSVSYATSLAQIKEARIQEQQAT